jgi:uncharacterized protein YfdQ (DUF2303 family)
MAKPALVLALPAAGGGSISHVAVPKGFELKAIDDEALLGAPRRTKAMASFVDLESFLAYVKHHAAPGTTVWCEFDSGTGRLSFRAVIDEHGPHAPAWRSHVATYTPKTSVEWRRWLERDGKGQKMAQGDFATFLEENAKDIVGGDGSEFPSSLQMMNLATEFTSNAERVLKSKANLQNGAVELVFSDGEDAETQQKMKVFAKFQVGFPVFWTMPEDDKPIKAWPLVARLKYQVSQAKVTFWYELIRFDVVYELAALELIDKARAGLGEVPLRMGGCT